MISLGSVVASERACCQFSLSILSWYTFLSRVSSRITYPTFSDHSFCAVSTSLSLFHSFLALEHTSFFSNILSYDVPASFSLWVLPKTIPRAYLDNRLTKMVCFFVPSSPRPNLLYGSITGTSSLWLYTLCSFPWSDVFPSKLSPFSDIRNIWKALSPSPFYLEPLKNVVGWWWFLLSY